MKFISNCFKGILIGSGAIIPGISSGVFCVIFGIYESLLDSVLYFFKDVKKNIKFLLPLVIGAAIGILIFSNFLNYLLYKFPIQTNSLFVGLIIGTIPSLIKDINSKESFKPSNLLYSIIAFSVAIFTVIMENTLPVATSDSVSFMYLILCGFCMSIGIVVPGVSSTIILMLLGIYSTYITSVSCLYFPVLIPIGIGVIIGSFVFMKLIKIFLKKFYAKTFYTIIGFTIGSTLILMPDLNFDMSALLSILCVLLGFFISNTLTNFQKGRSFLKNFFQKGPSLMKKR